MVQFVQGQEYARFSRIVFDTAPTGHTLRLLSLPDFVEASLGKIVRLRKRLSSATSMVRGLFGADGEQDSAVAKLEQLQERIRMVKDLFRDKEVRRNIARNVRSHTPSLRPQMHFFARFSQSSSIQA